MLDIEVDLVGDLGSFRCLCTLHAEEGGESHQQETKRKATEDHCVLW